MKFDCVTPVILTWNEESNIGRMLDQLHWAERVVIVDSHSSDSTLCILQNHSAVEVFQREFDNHSNQWNYGVDQVETEWVLTLDADYVLSNELIHELSGLRQNADGYRAHFIYSIFGRHLRRSLYPPRVVLFRPDRGKYIQDGHTQRLELDGAVRELHTPIYHDDRKSLTAWLNAQHRYAREEAIKLSRRRITSLNLPDRFRRWYIAPLLVIPYCLFAKRLILDGRAGWFYTLQRTYAEVLLALRLLERDLGLND